MENKLSPDFILKTLLTRSETHEVENKKIRTQRSEIRNQRESLSCPGFGLGGLAVDLLVCRSNETSEVVCVIEGSCALPTN